MNGIKPGDRVKWLMCRWDNSTYEQQGVVVEVNDICTIKLDIAKPGDFRYVHRYNLTKVESEHA